MKLRSDKFMLHPEYVFLCLALVFGGILLAVIPPMAGLDEHTHVARVNQLANGQLQAELVAQAVWYDPADTGKQAETALYGGDVDLALWNFSFGNLDRTHSREHPGYYQLPLWEHVEDGVYGSGETYRAIFSNTAINSPVAYAPYLVAFVIMRALTNSVFWMYYITRIVGFIFYVAVMFWCIKRLPFGKWACTALCLLPDVLINIVSVTADTMALAAVFLFAAQVLRLAAEPDDVPFRAMDWFLLALFALLLSFVKATYIPALGLLIVLPAVRPSLQKPKPFVALVGIAVMSLVMFAAWYSFAVSHVNTGAMWGGGEQIWPKEQLQYMISHPLESLSVIGGGVLSADVFQVTGESFVEKYRYAEIGFVNPIMSLLVIPALIVSLFAFDEREKVSQEFRRHEIHVIAVLAVLGMIMTVLVYVALYISFTPVGATEVQGVQSRYLVPTALFLLFAFSIAANRVRRLAETRVAGDGSAGAGEQCPGRLVAFCYSVFCVCERNRWVKVACVGMFVLLQAMLAAYVYGGYIG